MAAIDDEPKIKGAAVRELLLWHTEQHGAEASRRLVEGLPPHLASLVDTSRPALGVLASTWYPLSLTSHMLSRVIEGRTDEGRELARIANQFVVPRVIRGVYRAMYKVVASPELYSRHVGRLWRQLHSTGERTFTIRAPGEALSVVQNWPGHHPFLCWITIYTMVSLFEMMGFDPVTAERTACVGHGAARCETVLRWSRVTRR